MNTQATNRDPDILLTEQQAAQFISFTPRALQAWRINGSGPDFIKISARAVRYRKRDLISWAEERRRTSTSDKGGAQ